ncbi:UNKNOWN [Stylonychia lemnae]|uniref:Uncharacterized protein n=1 Tax=Stylonychia lemnae TaxID=5949 RepID=A0A078B773_STYLE|nr:UNKNOWN [Stylonychia lemnae]|eukprot:CDW90360.1 UNKNOWN [Stylonychia lemnae]
MERLQNYKQQQIQETYELGVQKGKLQERFSNQLEQYQKEIDKKRDQILQIEASTSSLINELKKKVVKNDPCYEMKSQIIEFLIDRISNVQTRRDQKSKNKLNKNLPEQMFPMQNQNNSQRIPAQLKQNRAIEEEEKKQDSLSNYMNLSPQRSYIQNNQLQKQNHIIESNQRAQISQQKDMIEQQLPKQSQLKTQINQQAEQIQAVKNKISIYPALNSQVKTQTQEMNKQQQVKVELPQSNAKNQAMQKQSSNPSQGKGLIFRQDKELPCFYLGNKQSAKLDILMKKFDKFRVETYKYEVPIQQIAESMMSLEESRNQQLESQTFNREFKYNDDDFENISMIDHKDHKDHKDDDERYLENILGKYDDLDKFKPVSNSSVTKSTEVKSVMTRDQQRRYDKMYETTRRQQDLKHQMIKSQQSQKANLQNQNIISNRNSNNEQKRINQSLLSESLERALKQDNNTTKNIAQQFQSEQMKPQNSQISGSRVKKQQILLREQETEIQTQKITEQNVKQNYSVVLSDDLCECEVNSSIYENFDDALSIQSTSFQIQNKSIVKDVNWGEKLLNKEEMKSEDENDEEINLFQDKLPPFDWGKLQQALTTWEMRKRILQIILDNLDKFKYYRRLKFEKSPGSEYLQFKYDDEFIIVEEKRLSKRDLGMPIDQDEALEYLQLIDSQECDKQRLKYIIQPL